MSPPYDRRGGDGGSIPLDPTRPSQAEAGTEPFGWRGWGVPPRVQLAPGQFWIWPGTAMSPAKPQPAGPIRIGDAERDKAIAALGDHFAAGRLSQEEFDERVEVAMKARFGADLEPLFADLPRPEPVPYGSYGVPGGTARRQVWPALMWLMPLVVVAIVVAAILFSTPWMLWGLFWVFVLSGFWRRRYYGYRRVAAYGRHSGRW